MSLVTTHGLARARELSRDRSLRAKELKAEGKQIIGYLSHLSPVEMLTALDLVPYAILGDISEPITSADTVMPTVVCPFIRSAMDLGLKGKYRFLDGVVMAHICEVGEKLAHIWQIYLELGYAHFLDTPHTTHPAARQQLRALLEDLKKTLERYTGKTMSDEALRRATTLHNEERALMRQLYDLRKPDPPLISGSESMEVALALTGLPVAEGSDLLRQVISEIKERRNGPVKRAVRLLVWGSIIDNTALIDLMEDVGANVVIDDTDLGSRTYFPDVELTPNPLDGMARRYLVDVKSPRTFQQAPVEGKTKDYMTDLKSRFDYMGEYARQWNANGVVLEVMRYCDIHAYEVPALKDYFDSIGLPSLYIEHDYSAASMAQLRTRLQGFLEIIG